MAHRVTLLRVHRLDRGLTLFELASRATISPGRLAAIEEGWARPTIDEVRHLADALAVTAESLIGPTPAIVEFRPLRVARA